MKFDKLNFQRRGLFIWEELPENKNKEFDIGSLFNENSSRLSGHIFVDW